MAKERTVVRGLVLREVDTKESDKILTVLTDTMGKVAVVAKGARSRRSKITAASQLLVYSEMTLTESHGWQILSEASTLNLFDQVRQDIELLSLGSYLAELTEAVAVEGVETEEILSLLLNTLYALGTLKKPQKLVKAAFEMRLMGILGFEPLVDACVDCGEIFPREPMLDVHGGVIRCRSCGKGAGLSMPLTPGALEAIRYVLYGDPKRLFSFSLEKEDLRRFAHASETYLHCQLERGFKTLDFYKSLSAALPEEEK